MEPCNAMFRPGGFLITDRALAVCNLPLNAQILDVGCGAGDTVAYLREKGLSAWGIDDNPPDNGNPYVQYGQAHRLPFAQSSMDGIFCECSFSLFSNPQDTLHEFARVLGQNGYLVLSDLYAGGEEQVFSGVLRQIYSERTFRSLLENAGFSVLHFEDFTHELKTMMAQMIMDFGKDAFDRMLGADPVHLRKARSKYGLIVAKKGEDSYG